MPRAISPKVTFRRVSAKSLMLQLDGPERPYPVYYFGKTVKFERPERPGQPYRWLTS